MTSCRIRLDKALAPFLRSLYRSTRYDAVAVGRTPHHAFDLLRRLVQLLDLRVILTGFVQQRQARRAMFGLRKHYSQLAVQISPGLAAVTQPAQQQVGLA